MAGKGDMIEVRIDTERIRATAPLCAETIIAGPEGDAVIAVGKEASFQELAVELQRDLRKRTDAEIGLVEEPAFDGIAQLSSNVIAVGHAANNKLLRRLHELRLLSNCDYPSRGHRLLTVHDPFGDGHNVVAILGATPAAARRGAQRLPAHLRRLGENWALTRRLFDIGPCPETPEPAVFVAEHTRPGGSVFQGHPISMLTALNYLNMTGQEEWARTFMGIATPLMTGTIRLGFLMSSAVDMWTDRLSIGWNKAEAFPYFSDEERRLLANFIASCTEYCYDSLTCQKWRITDAEHQIFNHHTQPAKGLFFGCMYLRRHGYRIEHLDAWMDTALRVMARAEEAGRSFDEGGSGYSWLVGNDLLEVRLAQGNTSYVTSPKMRHYADMAVAVLNSGFEPVPFGDCGSYHNAVGDAHSNLLLRAAEWQRDSGFKWAAEQSAPAACAADILTRDLASTPPERHLGLFILPLDPTIHRWTNLPRFPDYPPPKRLTNVEVEKCFDKISFRGGWYQDADYLLLQGFGSGQHGHPDANAISQYQVHGRLFLVDCDYIRRMPPQHNTVMVIRNGQHASIPVVARLDHNATFRQGAMTSTTLRDYNGCDWTRTLLWLKGDCVLVIDTLRANMESEYEFRCFWRTLGSAEMTARGMHADHDGRHFHVIELTDSERRLDIEPPSLSSSKYPPYKFGDASPKVLRESRRLRLAKGDEVCFINLLLPSGDCGEPPRKIMWEKPGRIRLYGGPSNVIVTREGIQIDDRWVCQLPIEQHLHIPNAVPADAASRKSVLPTVGSAPVAWESRLPASCECLFPLQEGGGLVGCSDGSIVRVLAGGEIHVLAKANERIGAVQAGRLYGEKDITYLAAGYDETLRLFHSDGARRSVVGLPNRWKNVYPAWGRAICLADLDADGRLWPVVGTAAWQVFAFRPDGSVRWTFDTAAHSVTSLVNADLNRDRRDEIVVGTVYFCVLAATADGQRLWADEDYNDYWSAGPCFRHIAVGDVDSDGELEVIAVGSDTLVHCINSRGEKKWTYSVGDEAAGLGLIDGAIVAASGTGDVHCIDGRGIQRWRVALSNPCVAMAVVGRFACVALEDGRLFRLDLDGRIVEACRLDARVTHLAGNAAGDVLAACQDGRLVCLGS